MQVMLDQEQWEAGAHLTVGDVLAEISERAHAQARIVTSLRLDERRITDRDLDPLFLAEPTAQFTHLTAMSQSMPAIMQSAQPSITQYGEELRKEGSALAGPLRFGRQTLSSLDSWLGKLADYLELMEGNHTAGGLTPWVGQLLDARSACDSIRMADLLEYEILPRLEPEP